MDKYDLQKIAAEFEAQGYVLLPDFLDAETLAALNDEIDRHYAPLLEQADALKASAQETTNKFACDVIPWNPCAEGNPVFLETQAREDLAAVTRACLGEGFTSGYSLVMLATAYGQGQSWHQDCPPEDAQAFNLNRLFYTRDVTEEDGAIVVVPGSHRFGLIPEGGHQEPLKGEVAITPRAGTLALLHGHVYHRVTPNRSGKPRLSVNFRAFPAGISASVCNVGVYRNGAINFRTGEEVDLRSGERKEP